MYELVTHHEAAAQLEALPDFLLTTYLEVRQAITLAPWTAGTSIRPSNPTSNLYAANFGPADFDGTVYYLIDETFREVHILEVLWL